MISLITILELGAVDDLGNPEKSTLGKRRIMGISIPVKNKRDPFWHKSQALTIETFVICYRDRDVYEDRQIYFHIIYGNLIWKIIPIKLKAE